MKVTPGGDSSATSKKYVDRKLDTKANKNDLNDHLKLDGTSLMQGNLQMNNNRITNLPNPLHDDEPVTRKFLTSTNSIFCNEFLDLDGNSKMRGNIQMNDNRISGLTNPPTSDDEATTKKYVDDNITKSHIKPSHTPKNVFQYLMDDVNEWSSEYEIKVDKFIDLQESPHSWDKRVLKITPQKIGSNYRFRLGLQMFRMKTNETYSLMVERYNRDYKTWQREQTFVNGTGVWVRTYNITKLQYNYGVNNTLYYTKTLTKFKKTSSSAPVFVYYTVHFDDNGGDLNTYPKDFINQIYLVAYGVEGLADNVDPEVYDAHEAFEIDKTKMKMLVPFDMNGKQLMNVNYDLKFGDIFKVVKCYFTKDPTGANYWLFKKDRNQVLTYRSPIVVHAIKIYRAIRFDETIVFYDYSNNKFPSIHIRRFTNRYTYNNITYINWLFLFDLGIHRVELENYTRDNIDVDPEVYDAHEAFEIDKTKMKMLVPFDMNGKQLMNVNYDLKFGDIFKVVKCYFTKDPTGANYWLFKKDRNQVLTYRSPIVVHAIKIYRAIRFDETIVFYDYSNNKFPSIHIRRFTNRYTYNNITYINWLFLFDLGIHHVELENYTRDNIDVDPEVYDAHEAFEIDKTKMKMLVPVDMNGKQLMNVNYDLKFGDIFKVVKCYFTKDPTGANYWLFKKDRNKVLTYRSPIVVHAIKIYRAIRFDETIVFYDYSNNKFPSIHIRRFTNRYTYNNITYINWLFLFDLGIHHVELENYTRDNIDVDLIISDN